MIDPFLGQIQVYGFNFPPKGWAVCAWQILPISQNTALFALIGTYFGGDGKSTFGLPDLRGRVPIGSGQGPGLDDYVLGEEIGTESVTLLSADLPTHHHGDVAVNFSSCTGNLMARTAMGNQRSAVGHVPAIESVTATYSSASPASSMASGMVSFANNPVTVAFSGSNFPHENRQPYLALNYCIALQGVFPTRA